MGGILIQSNPKAFSLLLDEFTSENINSGSEFRNKMLIPFLYALKTPIYLFMQLLLFLWQHFLSTISSWHAKGSLVFDLLIWKQALQPCFVALFFLWFREVARMCGIITEVHVSSYKQMKRATHQFLTDFRELLFKKNKREENLENI